jgi:hypothetical protein
MYNQQRNTIKGKMFRNIGAWILSSIFNCGLIISMAFAIVFRVIKDNWISLFYAVLFISNFTLMTRYMEDSKSLSSTWSIILILSLSSLIGVLGIAIIGWTRNWKDGLKFYGKIIVFCLVTTGICFVDLRLAKVTAAHFTIVNKWFAFTALSLISAFYLVALWFVVFAYNVLKNQHYIMVEHLLFHREYKKNINH